MQFICIRFQKFDIAGITPRHNSISMAKLIFNELMQIDLICCICLFGITKLLFYTSNFFVNIAMNR